MKERLLITSPDNMTKMTRLIGIVIIGVCLTFTYLFWAVFDGSNKVISQERLENDTDVLVDVVEQRLEVYADALYGSRALFLMNAELTREQWGVYMDSQNLRQRYPGLNNIGYVKTGDRSDAGKIEAFINRSLPDGVDSITIYPETLTDQLAVVAYLSLEGSEKFLGMNVLSQPHFKALVEQATIKSVPTASAPFDSTNVNHAGEQYVAVALPIYDGSYRQESTDDEKKAAVTGYVFISLNPKIIFENGIAVLPNADVIDLDVTDQDGRTIFKTDSKRYEGAYLTRTVSLAVGGRTWTAEFTAPPTYSLTMRETYAPAVFLAGGTLFMVILTSLYFYKHGVRIERKPKR